MSDPTAYTQQIYKGGRKIAPEAVYCENFQSFSNATEFKKSLYSLFKICMSAFSVNEKNIFKQSSVIYANETKPIKDIVLMYVGY